MFKHAYVRGIQTALVNSGRAAFPDEATASKVADYIADHVDIDPLAGVAPAMTHRVAHELVVASNWAQNQPGFKAASFNKIATWEEVAQLADHHAVQLMTKAAEGSTIEGGDKGNTQGQSPAGETKMDAAQRPPGYAEDSRGKTDVNTAPGAVGHEAAQPNMPSVSPSGANSLTRTASLADLFRKSAEGSTILGGDKGNDAMSSAEAKMDAAQRPAGYAVLPHQGALGAMMAQISGPAVIGRETAVSNKPGASVSGSNSLTEHSAKAAAEDPYITLFKKVATEVHPYLPNRLNENAKIAAVRACMGLTTEEKARYIHGLRTASDDMPAKDDDKDDDKGDKGDKDDKGDKGGLPAFIQAKIDARDDKEDKPDTEKKEASLQDYFRRIEAAQRA